MKEHLSREDDVSPRRISWYIQFQSRETALLDLKNREYRFQRILRSEDFISKNKSVVVGVS